VAHDRGDLAQKVGKKERLHRELRASARELPGTRRTRSKKEKATAQGAWRRALMLMLRVRAWTWA